MKFTTRRDVARFVGLIGVGLCVLAQFLPIDLSWWLAFVVCGAVLVLIAVLIEPPFWWGNRSFTTPINEPSHELRKPDEI